MAFKKSRQTLRIIGFYYTLLAIWLGTTAMHIPDGYLSPASSLVMFLLVLPFWVIGGRKIRRTQSARSVPLIALLAAFSFVIMMFNVPLPGGTTGHAVGAALAAVVLGPEVATIAVSMALIIQALFFGDGGILAIGANCFNMAVVVPYVSYAVYQLFARNAPLTSPRRVTGAAVGGWVGLTVAALFAGVEFGLQPLLFKAVDGSPLYAPYPLSISIPAMVLPHMAVASIVEGVLTGLVVAFLQRSNLTILEAAEKPALVAEAGSSRSLRWVWLVLAILAVATPLGLLAPGTAWGEWTAQELARLGIKAAPAGLQQLSGLWSAPLARYNLPVLGDARFGYILSAVLGIAAIGIIAWLITRLLTWKSRSHSRTLEKTLHGIAETLERGLFAEEISSQAGLLQSLDARVKLISVLALLAVASLSHSLVVIAAIYGLALILALRSAIPSGFFIKRVWLTLPFFTGMIIIPALFITPGPALARLPLGLVITQTGLTTVLFLLLRVSTSVSLTLLLILTTPWNTVLSALSVLRVPDVFILILGMTYRYIYLLLHTANDMFLSRQSRLVGQMNAAEERRLLAAASGTLLGKSFNLSSEVYLAMQSRGFRGSIVTLKPFKMVRRDWAWLGIFLSIACCGIILGR